MAPTTWFLALLLPLGGALRLGSPPAVTRRELGGLAASSLVPLLAPAAGAFLVACAAGPIVEEFGIDPLGGRRRLGGSRVTLGQMRLARGVAP